MEVMTNEKISTLIERGIANGYSYEAFRTLVSQLVVEEKTTGAEQTEALINYTMLNDRRMKRWDKTLKFDDETIQTIASSEAHLSWLVLTESWCGDAGHSIPVLHKIASLSKGIDLKIILRDENEALMDHFLTNGGRSIPKLIAYDRESKTVKYTWGPRPSRATTLVEAYKAEHGKLDPEFKESLQKWYNTDKGAAIIEDILHLMSYNK